MLSTHHLKHTLADSFIIFINCHKVQIKEEQEITMAICKELNEFGNEFLSCIFFYSLLK